MAAATEGDMIGTVEAIYTAGLDPQLWPQALGLVTQTIGGVGTALEIIDRRSFVHREFHAFGLATVGQRAYLDHYARLNPRFPHALHQKPGDVNLDYQMMDERGMDHSPFYAEFLASQDLRYTIGGILSTAKHELGVIAVQRSRKQGHVDEAQVACMERLVPHVSQAMDMARRLKGAGQARHSLEHALDWLADGVALMRADGAVVHANHAFAGIARRGDGIRIRKGAIEFAAAGARDQLKAALAALRRLNEGDIDSVSADFMVGRPSGASSYLVSVRPLPAGDPDRRTGAELIVFVRDPLNRNTAAIGVLREMFGLTEAEAALAQALQQGLAPDDYARTRAVSLNTVYTHLRRLKEKTACRRLPALIRKLNDLRLPLQDD